jgi:translocation and assembly module TamA
LGRPAYAFDPFFGLFGSDEEEPPKVALPDPTIPTLPYTVQLEGPADADMAERIRGELTVMKRQPRGTPSVATLQARLDADVERVRTVLHAYGYYDGTVQAAIAGTQNLSVRIVVQQGVRFRIGSFRLVWQEGRPPPVALKVEAVGKAASGRHIVAEGERIVGQLKAEGYFDARFVDRQVILERASGTVAVTVTLSAGEPVRVGSFEVRGQEDLPAERIVRLSKLDPGELLTPERMKDAENDLLGSALFNAARIEPVGRSQARTMRLNVEERLPRSVSGAAHYSMRSGIGAELAWEHRNLFGDAELLRTELSYGTLKQEAELFYREYDFIWRDYALLATLNYTHEDVNGAQFQQISLIGTFERELARRLTLRVGGSLEYVTDELDSDDTDSNSYNLAGLRAELVYDGSNDLLDPTEGYRASVRAIPYFEIGGGGSQFTILEASGSVYWALDEDRRFVLAGRGRLGTILGASRSEIPLSKRFFAGGGGSIRGFPYKMAGPVITVLDDSSDDIIPIGGKSVIELNGEFRYRVSEAFGAVAFVDAGGAYDGPRPTSGGDHFVGAGLGVRYYSPIGPIRVDVAVPVTRPHRDIGDYEIYVSIGQAF